MQGPFIKNACTPAHLLHHLITAGRGPDGTSLALPAPTLGHLDSKDTPLSSLRFSFLGLFVNVCVWSLFLMTEFLLFPYSIYSGHFTTT